MMLSHLRQFLSMSKRFLFVFQKIIEATVNLYNNCLFSNGSHIIWLGDLNYRIALSYCSAKALVEMHNWKQLLEKDQVKCSALSVLFVSILLHWLVGIVCCNKIGIVFSFRTQKAQNCTLFVILSISLPFHINITTNQTFGFSFL
jgi:hypothetical protein